MIACRNFSGRNSKFVFPFYHTRLDLCVLHRVHRFCWCNAGERIKELMIISGQSWVNPSFKGCQPYCCACGCSFMYHSFILSKNGRTHINDSWSCLWRMFDYLLWWDQVVESQACLRECLWRVVMFFFVFLGLVFSVGVSYWQYIDLNSPRNLFVISIAIYIGCGFSIFFEEQRSTFNTGKTFIH